MNDDIAFLRWFDDLSFFVRSQNFRLLITVLVVYLAALWLAIVIWVVRDAMHRSTSILFQIGAVLLNIFLPIFGLILYLIIRPEKTLLEKYHEDMEYRLLEGGADYCFTCATHLKEGFSFCPNCGEEILQTCTDCQQKFSRRWQICPYCGVEEGQGAKKKGSRVSKEKK
jgi:predicted RNA-binding Zn-ribbon protein involved in translation (DUF1610 family)